jgi:hypothetical protein
MIVSSQRAFPYALCLVSGRLFLPYRHPPRSTPHAAQFFLRERSLFYFTLYAGIMLIVQRGTTHLFIASLSHVERAYSSTMPSTLTLHAVDTAGAVGQPGRDFTANCGVLSPSPMPVHRFCSTTPFHNPRGERSQFAKPCQLNPRLDLSKSCQRCQ